MRRQPHRQQTKQKENLPEKLKALSSDLINVIFSYYHLQDIIHFGLINKAYYRLFQTMGRQAILKKFLKPSHSVFARGVTADELKTQYRQHGQHLQCLWQKPPMSDCKQILDRIKKYPDYQSNQLITEPEITAILKEENILKEFSETFGSNTIPIINQTFGHFIRIVDAESLAGLAFARSVTPENKQTIIAPILDYLLHPDHKNDLKKIFATIHNVKEFACAFSEALTARVVSQLMQVGHFTRENVKSLILLIEETASRRVDLPALYQELTKLNVEWNHPTSPTPISS